MVQGNVTADNSVDPLVPALVTGIPIGIAVIFVLYFLWNHYEREIHHYFITNNVCLCLLPTRIHPDGSTGRQGVRQPTSAERTIALGILAQSSNKTTITEILDDLVKGPPNNGTKPLESLPEPEWKKKKVVIYDPDKGVVMEV